MPRTIRLLAIAVLLSVPACRTTPGIPSPSNHPSPSAGTVLVTRVTDGDTIHVLSQGRDVRVRLIGVDTPEVGWYGGQAECFGAKAGLYTRRRLDGRHVRLSFDVDRFDRYERTLAYVYLGRELFNLTLVQRGYARADPVPPDTRMAALFTAAESRARGAGLGLWSRCRSYKQ